MERIIAQAQDISYILHLGDCCADAELMARRFPDLNFEWVRGNCDYSGCPYDKLLTLGGKRIFITHGHKYNVKTDYLRLVYAAMSREADACFFGHSHEPALFYEKGILFMNPGSISQPRGMPQPSYGLAEISEGGIEGKIVCCPANDKGTGA